MTHFRTCVYLLKIEFCFNIAFQYVHGAIPTKYILHLRGLVNCSLCGLYLQVNGSTHKLFNCHPNLHLWAIHTDIVLHITKRSRLTTPLKSWMVPPKLENFPKCQNNFILVDGSNYKICIRIQKVYIKRVVHIQTAIQF